MKMLKGRAIFLVEDNPVNRAVVATILKNAGAEVPFDHWGDTTLRTMAEYGDRLDLILLDLMLPRGRSGYDIFDAIKKQPELADVPVVAVSAADPDIEIPKARKKGFDGFISKPIDRFQFPKDLLKVIEGEQVWHLS